MKKILLFLLIIAVKPALAQYKPIDQGSTIRFTIQNFGFDVNGSFTGLRGAIDFDPENPGTAHLVVDIDAGTINTGNNLRDDHLRAESYFDVKNHPRIHFESAKIAPTNKPGILMISGKLNIKNQSKIISFPFTATPLTDGYQFKATFKINRKDFSVGGTSTISDELQVTLNIVTRKT
jgi:polyisoprenoid-binding protein YceI